MLKHKLPRNEWTLEAAAHLLSRAAFGGSPLDVQKLFHMGHEQAVNLLLTTNQKDLLDQLDVKETILIPSINQFIINNNLQTNVSITKESVCFTSHSLAKYLSINSKMINKIHGLFSEAINQIRKEWLRSMIDNTFSFKDKLALFWHSNIPIGKHENNNAIPIKKYLDVLRTDGLGNFETFISSISKQYEMAHYLNLPNNRVNNTNENFARELLELFTLGEGNYTENDIKEVARVFTGFAFDLNFNFKINENKVDKNLKTIFGQTRNFTPDDLIKLCVEKKECSEHIATKLWKFYVSEKIDKNLIEELGFLYREQQMNTSNFLRIIFLSKIFYSKEFMSSQIKSPVQLVVQGIKQLGFNSFDTKVNWLSLLRDMNQELFNPPNVRGWQGGQEWITASTLIARYKTANRLTSLLTVEDLSSIVPEGLAPNAICDLISARLFYAPSFEKLRRNIVAFIEKANYGSVEAKKELVKLAMSTPQYQLV